jgi:hypothetical protein
MVICYLPSKPGQPRPCPSSKPTYIIILPYLLGKSKSQAFSSCVKTRVPPFWGPFPTQDIAIVCFLETGRQRFAADKPGWHCPPWV